MRQSPNRGAEFLSAHLADALVADDEERARSVFEGALELGFSITDVHREIVAPAMMRVADQLVSGHIAAEQEQRAVDLCAIVNRRLSEATSVPFEPGSARAVVALVAIEPQHRILGMRMVADLLRSKGFDARCFGPQLPTSALRTVVGSIRPHVVGLTWETPAPVVVLADAITQVHAVSPETRIMLGGRAVPPAMWESGYPRVTMSAEAVDVVEDLLASPAVPPAPVLAELLAARDA